MATQLELDHRSVEIPIARDVLRGDLSLPHGATAIVLFAHGSGSGRLSPRNRLVAEELNHQGLATLLIDLLTVAEERVDQETAELRFDIELLAGRLLFACDWMARQDEVRNMNIGLFGASTGAAAALVAAARRADRIDAVVSRGGRPDLAGTYLRQVRAPVLLIVGGNDYDVIELNEQAIGELRRCTKEMAIIPGATHLFEEPGALEQVAALAGRWFVNYLHPEVH